MFYILISKSSFIKMTPTVNEVPKWQGPDHDSILWQFIVILILEEMSWSESASKRSKF
jgi:hypothetical protein